MSKAAPHLPHSSSTGIVSCQFVYNIIPHEPFWVMSMVSSTLAAVDLKYYDLKLRMLKRLHFLPELTRSDLLSANILKEYYSASKYMLKPDLGSSNSVLDTWN